MDAEICLKKMQEVGALSCATVDKNGLPQVRTISAIHYEKDRLYFLTAKGKNFCHELLATAHCQFLALTKNYEMIRLTGIAKPVPDAEQQKWISLLFKEQPVLFTVYPGETGKIADIIFEISSGYFEYFDLSTTPIYREQIPLGSCAIPPKGYRIMDSCISCGSCLASCPQGCIEAGEPYRIDPAHCLQCGNCQSVCPAEAVERLG